MELIDVIYPPSGRTIGVEATVRAVAWFSNKELGKDYSEYDVVSLALQNVKLIWEELEGENGYGSKHN